MGACCQPQIIDDEPQTQLIKKFNTHYKPKPIKQEVYTDSVCDTPLKFSKQTTKTSMQNPIRMSIFSQKYKNKRTKSFAFDDMQSEDEESLKNQSVLEINFRYKEEAMYSLKRLVKP
ncbi:hypothetical protein pb186bvf_018751 [Paramecium bursaria]